MVTDEDRETVQGKVTELQDAQQEAAGAPRLTGEPGEFTVAAAFSDPPFEVERNGQDTGFDIELMRAISAELGLVVRFIKYAGDDFNGVFDGLTDGRYDAVISGTTITPDRQQVALFSDPYLEFNQGLIVNRVRTPQVHSTGDLRGLVAGIQRGNTSDAVARKLLAEGAIAQIRYYPYTGIFDALDDLTAGRIGAVIKLFPVALTLIRDRPDLAVVQQIPTHEQLGIAFAKTNVALRDAVNGALAALKQRGTFDSLCRAWLP
ncbi:MAG: ABC transporter substrate-binding protein [Dehalococcoidia bacterium]